MSALTQAGQLFKDARHFAGLDWPSALPPTAWPVERSPRLTI